MNTINVVDSVVTSNKNLRNEQTKTTLEITRTTFTANPFLVTFFNFFFYLALVPFKTVLDQNQNKYQIKTYCVHQITCAVSHIGTIFYVFSFVLEDFLKIQSTDSSSLLAIFDFGSSFGGMCSMLCITFIIWRRRDKYLKVIESTRLKFEIENGASFRVIQIMVRVVLVAVTIFFAINNWFMVVGEYTERKVIFLQKNYSFGNFSKEHSFGRNVDILNFILQYLSLAYLSQMYVIGQGILLILATTMLRQSTEFRQEMKQVGFQQASGVEQGILQYRKLKHATNLIRKVYGDTLLGYYVSTVAYYAEAPHILLGIRGRAEKILMAYFAISGVIWLIAAEFHNKVKNTVLEWVEFHIDRNDICCDYRLRLHSISGEITSENSNGIALSNKCFSVTYKHVASMLGLVVTYGIIVFQLHQSQKTSSSEYDN